MALTILDILIIGEGIIGLIGIFFPEFLFKFANPASERKYDKRDGWKYRLAGLIIILTGMIFYIYDNFQK